MTNAPRLEQLSRPAGPTPDTFRAVIGNFLSGVTVVTTMADGIPYGTTASAVTSLCLEPPMVVLCLNQSSATAAAIGESRRFALNILDEDSADLAVRFATKGPDKFAGTDTTPGTTGLPLLSSSLAWLEAEIAETVQAGTHTIFVGKVLGAEARPGRPLAYFRGGMGRLAVGS
ncbi:flavin reductase family protein [Nocardia sp. NPDC050378]|uniref:flavin reductase family protein n=1 Tax=Nocardia sp. NPDC050378 TaxID=3155400 RepID=UPI0033CABB72